MAILRPKSTGALGALGTLARLIGMSVINSPEPKTTLLHLVQANNKKNDMTLTRFLRLGRSNHRGFNDPSSFLVRELDMDSKVPKCDGSFVGTFLTKRNETLQKSNSIDVLRRSIDGGRKATIGPDH